MIRRIADFVLILFFVWACMLLGFWIIESLIVPLNTHSALVSNMAKPAISLLLVLSWFWLWREIVGRVFWNALKRG